MTTPVRQGDGIQPIGVGVMLVDAKPVIANRFGKFERRAGRATASD
jgi:hypothetical protein